MHVCMCFYCKRSAWHRALAVATVKVKEEKETQGTSGLDQTCRLFIQSLRDCVCVIYLNAIKEKSIILPNCTLTIFQYIKR